MPTMANIWAVFGLSLSGCSAFGGLIKWESTILKQELNKISKDTKELKKELDKTSKELAETKVGLRVLAAEMKSEFKALHLA